MHDRDNLHKWHSVHVMWGETMLWQFNMHDMFAMGSNVSVYAICSMSVVKPDQTS